MPKRYNVAVLQVPIGPRASILSSWCLLVHTNYLIPTIWLGLPSSMAAEEFGFD